MTFAKDLLFLLAVGEVYRVDAALKQGAPIDASQVQDDDDDDYWQKLLQDDDYWQKEAQPLEPSLRRAHLKLFEEEVQPIYQKADIPKRRPRSLAQINDLKLLKISKPSPSNMPTAAPTADQKFAAAEKARHPAGEGGRRRSAHTTRGSSGRAESQGLGWRKDSDSNTCTGCKKEWDVFMRRRHHCRACGDLFCDECSSKRTELKGQNMRKPVRVCDECHQLEDNFKNAKWSIEQDLKKFIQAETNFLAKVSLGVKFKFNPRIQRSVEALKLFRDHLTKNGHEVPINHEVHFNLNLGKS
jgi:hypothetical protein